MQRNNLVHFDVSRAFDPATRSAPKTWTPPDLGVPPGGSRAGESTFLGALHPSKTEARAGHDFSREIFPEYRPAREPLRNWLRNTAFEYAIYHEAIGNEVDPLLHWRRIGNVEVEFHPGFNDPPANDRDSILNNSVRLPGGEDNGIAQTVEGLLPGVEYVFSGYAKHPDGGSVEFAVRSEEENLASQQSRDVPLETDRKRVWRHVQVRFKAPPSGTADFTITNRGQTDANLDDTGVVPILFGQATPGSESP